MKDFLIVQDTAPWDSNAYLNIFNTLGLTYDIKTISDSLNVLNNYKVVYIVSDQYSYFYNTYVNNKVTFSNFVYNGGRLLFDACTAGWHSGSISNFTLPGGVIVNQSYDYNNYIVDNNNPIVTGNLTNGVALTNTDLNGRYCSHDYFTSLPSGSDIILKGSTNQATLVEYFYGAGSVIASGLTWEFYVPGGGYNWGTLGGEGSFAVKAYDDLILYALSGAYFCFDTFPSTVRSKFVFNGPAFNFTNNNIYITNQNENFTARSFFYDKTFMWNKAWEITFNIEVPRYTNDWNQADGFALVWSQNKNFLGSNGGAVGYFSGNPYNGPTNSNLNGTQALAFRDWTYRDVIYAINGNVQAYYQLDPFLTDPALYSIVGNKYYWINFDGSQTLEIRWASSNNKPINSALAWNASFSTYYYIGFSGATGAGTQNAILKSFCLHVMGAGENPKSGWDLLL